MKPAALRAKRGRVIEWVRLSHSLALVEHDQSVSCVQWAESVLKKRVERRSEKRNKRRIATAKAVANTAEGKFRMGNRASMARGEREGKDKSANEHGQCELKSAAPLAAVNSRLEDALYLQADKLLALCTVQSAWVNADCEPSPATRNHYALVIEEQALELRRLLDQLFL